MRADLITEGLHLGCTDLIKAAAPATCGQAMEVPDFMAKLEGFCPSGVVSLFATGIAAARMLTPGAIRSGC